MAARYIFNTSGQYVAFVEGNHLFDPTSNWLGFIADGDDVYSAKDGLLLGTLTGDDRLVVNKERTPTRRLRPLRPLKPLRPLRPLRRLRMTRLPHHLRDYFETEAPKPVASKFLESLGGLLGTGTITPELAADILKRMSEQGGFKEALSADSLLDSELRTKAGKFLGRVSRNRFDSDSLVNTFGPYGSRYSSDSIFNQYSPYGSKYGAESPFNQYSSSPPMFVKNNETLGYLSINKYLTPRIDPQDFINWLENG